MPNAYNLGYRAGAVLGELFSDNAPHLPSLQEAVTAVSRFPVWYKDWWLNLVANDPIHVLVETTLALAILYILVSRSKADWKADTRKDKLTPKEELELLRDWKHSRAPLTPHASSSSNSELPPPMMVVHKINGRTLDIERLDAVASSSSNKNNNVELQTVLNFGNLDFLGRSSDEHDNNNSMKQAALDALDQYGCGACGPRGFYGTVDVHLQLERQFAEFCGTDDAILYSDGASTCSSTVAAFAKRGDLLVVDEAICEPWMTGVTLSRANVKWFKHNDMEDLQRVLEQVRASDKKFGRKTNVQRRFIVVEGLYKNTGSIVPLDKVVELKHEYCFRLMLDESNSFGVIGATGRGVTELYGKKPMRDVEITTISLENAIGSIGGMTVGTEEVVDHQRLSGSGYCFSASSPPFAATAAMKSLELLKTQPDTLKQLHMNLSYLNLKLDDLCKQMEDVLVVTSDERSPMVMLRVADIPETEDLNEIAFLGEVVRESLCRGVAFVATGQQRGHVRTEPPPAIRLTVSAVNTKEDIDRAIEVLGESVDVVLSRFHEEDAQ